MALRIRNYLTVCTRENGICSNCNLQQNGWKDWWEMVCHCGCGKSSIACVRCVKEHARRNEHGIKTLPYFKKNECCFMCMMTKC